MVKEGSSFGKVPKPIRDENAELPNNVGKIARPKLTEPASQAEIDEMFGNLTPLSEEERALQRNHIRSIMHPKINLPGDVRHLPIFPIPDPKKLPRN